MTALGSAALHAITIPETLWLTVGPVRVERVDERRWRFGAQDAIAFDDLGLPVLDGGEIWPLEEPENDVARHR